MNFNKYSVVGIIFILLGVFILSSDLLTPYIRPITYLFLMGSTKGKDIIFFILFGFFLIVSQLDLNVDNDKYLKWSIYIGALALIIGLILEIAMRVELGIKWNTIFVAMDPNMCSSSIIHSHIYKSIFGEFFNTYLPNVAGINEARCLFRYIPGISVVFVIFFPILLILQILAIQRRNFMSILALAFFFPCLLIGTLDGGLFATPSYFGLCGPIIILRNRYYPEMYAEKLLKIKNKYPISLPEYDEDPWLHLRYLSRRMLPYIIVFILLVLRFGLLMVGSDPTAYEVIISNPKDNIEIINDYTNVKITNDPHHYYLSPQYNEMELLISLKFDLNHKCDYYTMSWNFYSYLPTEVQTWLLA